MVAASYRILWMLLLLALLGCQGQTTLNSLPATQPSSSLQDEVEAALLVINSTTSDQFFHVRVKPPKCLQVKRLSLGQRLAVEAGIAANRRNGCARDLGVEGVQTTASTHQLRFSDAVDWHQREQRGEQRANVRAFRRAAAEHEAVHRV